MKTRVQLKLSNRLQRSFFNKNHAVEVYMKNENLHSIAEIALSLPSIPMITFLPMDLFLNISAILLCCVAFQLQKAMKLFNDSYKRVKTEFTM